MAYNTPITIKEVIDNIRKRHYVLPAIQREFVWGADQIETLFDSLMRDYPISTFLFWEVEKDKIKDFQFYEFLKEYHETNNTHTQKADPSDDQGIVAVLDGQQRMTSLYLALTGTYAYKKPYMARTNPKAYPERKLYLNLLKPSDNLEEEYDFRFLTKDDVAIKNDGFYWFECGKILSFKEKNEIYDYLEDHDLSDTGKNRKESVRFARNTLNRFYDVIHKDRTISYYLEKDEELDKVLQIFIRINSGGTKLSYSDLLLSMATAQWKEKDARDAIRNFVKEINKIGEGFDFNKDLVLKNCLVLADFGDVAFKAKNFNKSNMNKIEQQWEETSSALRSAIELVAKFGYNRENLISNNAIIPIAYFIFKNKCDGEILHNQKWERARKDIKKWLARVLLKGTFGGTTDSIYPNMRKLINENSGGFPLKEIIDFYKGKSKSISFSNDEIDTLLESQYRDAKTYCALTLLYPGLNRSFNFHQDHIHPKSKFNKRSMRKEKFSEEQIEDFQARVNSLANLQLLEKTENHEKKNKSFKEWLNAKYPDKSDRDRYLEQHHIKPDQSLEFEDFTDFIEARRKTLKGQFTSILDATPDESGEE